MKVRHNRFNYTVPHFLQAKRVKEWKGLESGSKPAEFLLVLPFCPVKAAELCVPPTNKNNLVTLTSGSNRGVFSLRTGVSQIFEPVGTFEILTSHGERNHKMA
ncbi:UNVERIFIED_CONTAM: hypothetical protein K2H54_022873, partial [Gekko kuhli]